MPELEFEELFGPHAKATKRGRLQNDDSPNAARIRDNQRRSRARHKEYVDDLQRRLLEYERRGAEASLGMQRAARDVALENSRLRSLLARNGVLNEEVDTYLASFGSSESRDSSLAPMTPVFESVTSPHSKVAVQQLAPMLRHSESSRLSKGISDITQRTIEWATGGSKTEEDGHCRPSLASPTIFQAPYTPDSTPISPMDRLSVLADASIRRNCCDAADNCAEPNQHGRRPGVSRPEGPTPTRQSGLPNPSPMEMSCNAAARIIADMQGHDDKDVARASLGCCNPEEECLVKNTTVFRMLDNC